MISENPSKIEKGKSEVEKSTSELRREKLAEAVERMKRELPEKELATVKAILLFGSTARGNARENSDVDLFVALDEKQEFDVETFKKIAKAFDESLPDVELQYAARPITLNSRWANFLVKPSVKHPEQPSVWQYLYVASEQAREEIEAALKEARAKYSARFGK